MNGARWIVVMVVLCMVGDVECEFYRVGVKVAPPLVNVSGGELVGYSIDFLRSLSEENGFQYELVLKNVTANELVNMVRDGTDGVNMSIAAITLTAPRSEEVLLSTPYFDLGLRVLVLSSQQDPSLWQFLVPLERNVWLVGLMSFVVLSMSLFYFERTKSESFRGGHVIGASVMGMYKMFQVMVQQMDFPARTAEGKVIIVASTFLFFILASTYTAELTSFMTLTTNRASVYDVDNDGVVTQEDLPNFISVLAIPINTSVEEWFVREVARGTRGFISCPTYLDCIEMVARGEAGGTIYDGPIAESAVANDARFNRIRLLGDPMDLQGYGIALKKDETEAVNVLNRDILLLRENGFTDTLRSKWLANVSTESKPDLEPVYLRELGGVFIVSVSFVVAAWVIHLWKIGCSAFMRLKPREPTKADSGPTSELLDMWSSLHKSGIVPDERTRETLTTRMVLEHLIERHNALRDSSGRG